MDRDALLWRLDGARWHRGEPILLVLVEHLSLTEARCVGDVFDRPLSQPRPRWDDDSKIALQDAMFADGYQRRGVHPARGSRREIGQGPVRQSTAGALHTRPVRRPAPDRHRRRYVQPGQGRRARREQHPHGRGRLLGSAASGARERLTLPRGSLARQRHPLRAPDERTGEGLPLALLILGCKNKRSDNHAHECPRSGAPTAERDHRLGPCRRRPGPSTMGWCSPKWTTSWCRTKPQ